MVLVGGATRLTESGLSIVEWKPVTGALPPLNQEQWTQAFEGYKTIPQYRELNAGMSLAEFKTIFWWEWSHRLLGRVIGIAYLLPFLWFLWRGALSADLRRRLWLIFGLGALQGAVGWWMVASGLSQRVEVSHYRLATHLVLALFIFAAIVWTLRRLADRPPVAASARLKITSVVLLALTFVQLYLGALVAGLRAGKVYNTWPDIDGGFIPSAARLLFDTPWWRNLFDNALTVQFEHRMTAYALFALAILHAVRRGSLAGRGRRDQRRGVAGGGDHAAGDAGYSHAAEPGADRSGIGASGGCDRGLDACDLSGRADGRAATETTRKSWFCRSASPVDWSDSNFLRVCGNALFSGLSPRRDPANRSCVECRRLYLRGLDDKMSQTQGCSCRLHSSRPPSFCSVRGSRPCW